MTSAALVLVSGGMDSCVTAAIAHAESDRLAFLHVSYGQRTEARERKAFNDIADYYGVRKKELDLYSLYSSDGAYRYRNGWNPVAHASQ